ncbi:MAG: helix-turn-helix transcriptional regulator [Acidisphaera sp.]|nr:helix-turn-helix transcriptional regulator [Acidisphaera sp.]
MVRKTQIEVVDDAPRPLVALGNDYPDGHVIPPHRHRRGQLLSSLTGTLLVTTPTGTWVMPPQRGMWIPPNTFHDVRVMGAVRMQSLYVEPEATLGLPDCCQVVGISPFMRSLIFEALDLPVLYDLEGRAGTLMSLIQHEMRRLPLLPLSLPLPIRPELAERCRAFLRQPHAHDAIEKWCTALGMSRRSFTRLFRQETGLSFVAWRQQACLVAALPRLAAGESVTAVAMAMGYDNPAAFTTMFKRSLGASPRSYLPQA